MILPILNSLLAEALTGAGLPVVTFNASGMAEIDVRGLTVALEFIETDERLVMYCSLGRLPSDAPSGLYEFLLEINLFGSRLRGGHLGLYPPTRTLLFSFSLAEADLTAARLANALQRFTEQATRLITEIGNHLEEDFDKGGGIPLFAGTMLWV